MQNAYFAQFGWTGPNVAGGVPGPNTVWRLTAGSTLTPTSPITLTWDNGQGLRFTRVVSVDDRYVFSIKDTVQNLGTQAITIAPYGSVQRRASRPWPVRPTSSTKAPSAPSASRASTGPSRRSTRTG